MYFCSQKPVRFNTTPRLNYFLQHSVHVKLAANLNVWNLITLLHIESEPIYHQQSLYHVAVHAYLGVYFIVFTQRLSHNHRKHSQKRSEAHKLVTVEMVDEGLFVTVDFWFSLHNEKFFLPVDLQYALYWSDINVMCEVLFLF